MTDVTTASLSAVLGEHAVQLIELIANAARENQLNAYMVGGMVRDLLLGRRNLDMDFVIEGDAIAFANHLRSRFGGDVTPFRPFGTAKWELRGAALGIDGQGDDLPDVVDFAMARSEIYEQPAALPSVYPSSIKLDLVRRDFTVNTLAMQVSPANSQGQLLDFFGGVSDLNARLLRVLHDLSFVDDPTRILRAVRFERRLNFHIESHTMELIQTALPMLSRITGERLRNELTLLLLEPDPAGSFALLAERGILQAITPSFVFPAHIDLGSRFRLAEISYPPELGQVFDRGDVYWALLLSALPAERAAEVCERLLFGKTMTETVQTLIYLLDLHNPLNDPHAKPSRIAEHLEHLAGDAALVLYVAWLLLPGIGRANIEHYVTEWRSIRPKTDGHRLQARGLHPSPCFRVLLNRLRAAWLDGEISSAEQEDRLLESLIASGICDS